MSRFIHLIADYGRGDPAFSEVIHRLTSEDPTVKVQPTTVEPLSTVATGFWIEQLGVHNPAFDELLIYSNTAPRSDDPSPRDANEGGELRYAELDSGTEVVAVDAGYNFSFVKDHLETFRAIDVETRGSQFRSRDYFPEKVIEIAHGDHTSVSAGKPLSTIPDRPEQTVCHVDGYGNIKTSIRASEFDPDRGQVDVEIGSSTATVTTGETVFAVEEGQLVLAPGSAGGADGYLEVFRRGGSAAVQFGEPEPGDPIRIS